MNVFTLTNVNTKIIGKLSKRFISEVCIKLVALRINQYQRSSFKKVGVPGLEAWFLLLCSHIQECSFPGFPTTVSHISAFYKHLPLFSPTKGNGISKDIAIIYGSGS